MHDTAFQMGTLAMNIYADLQTASILEIGSQAINGSLRASALPATNYVGVDIEAGEGVDVVVEPGAPLPLEDGSFDLVLATSVFEHDPCFWMTFVEMCRKTREGGYIYINAPSNGIVHRYPEDHWRFYPDSGGALARWAISQGQHVSLVESFIADRGEFVWNDFVAVFRKGRITKSLPPVFIHENVPCSNIITWKSKEILKPREFPQDLELLDAARHEVASLRGAIAEAERERVALVEQTAQLNDKLAEVERLGETYRDELAELRAELERARNEIAVKESEIRQRQEEIEQTRAELAQALVLVSETREEMSKNEKLIDVEAKLRKQSEVLLASMGRELEQAHADKEAAEDKVDERIGEIVTLTTLLADKERLARQSQDQIKWLQEVGAILAAGSVSTKGRLLAMLPATFRSKRQQKLLKRCALFDGQAYLAAHPDVAADGADPLHHYLKHGMSENRRRG